MVGRSVQVEAHLGARLGARLGFCPASSGPRAAYRSPSAQPCASSDTAARGSSYRSAPGGRGVLWGRPGAGGDRALYGHAGYDGVMFGLPDRSYHLEFTQKADGSPCPAPSQDDLLVFYVPDAEARQKVGDRLIRLGHGPVAAENPWWEKIEALTFEDPDGWRVVIAPTTGI